MKSSFIYIERVQHDHSNPHHCHPPKGRPDFWLWGSFVLIIVGFLIHWMPFKSLPSWLMSGSHTIVELMMTMALGLAFAVIAVGLMDFIPREKFHSLLGEGKGMRGLVRASMAGVLLDLCSHGILLVAMKLYERGASLGQVIAFLVSSPWNSFSMTLILWSLIGLPLTLAFIFLSAIIALLSGFLFDFLVEQKILPPNPNAFKGKPFEKIPWWQIPHGENRSFGAVTLRVLVNGLKESRPILKWIFIGVLLTALLKEVISPEQFANYFGPDLLGVVATLFAATVIEVCSEGSAPLAAELVHTAHAPGNGFTFLMAGVSTDYTEIMALKETTKSWKIAFFLPLVTLPQIIVLGLILNRVFGS